MVGTKIFCLLGLGLASCAKDTLQQGTHRKDCYWFSPSTNERLTGWEFELKTPIAAIVAANRTQTLALVTKQLQALVAADEHRQMLSMNVSYNTLRTSMFRQLSHSISTRDGRSLIDHSHQLPWKEPGFLRLRAKLAEERPSEALSGIPGETPLGFPPGYGDLTLKLKNVDPSTVPAFERNMSTHVRPWGKGGKKSKLHVKIEEDSYCTYADRANYEARYGPTPINTDITTLQGVELYFPELGAYLGLPREHSLPFYRERYFSKSVWDISLKGVQGVANMNLDFASEDDLLSGTDVTSAELSFRLKRENIEAVHDIDSESYYDSLNAVGELCGLLFDLGWDEASGMSAQSLLTS